MSPGAIPAGYGHWDRIAAAVNAATAADGATAPLLTAADWADIKRIGVPQHDGGRGTHREKP